MQEVFLNLLPNGVPPVCYISQYDGTSRVIRFHLLNGTESLTLDGSETITLNFRKPDREEVTLAIENTSSNYIDLVISSELSDKHGEGFGEFRIQGLGTLSFKMYIESDAYGDSLKTRSVSGPIATFETDLAEDLIKLDVDLEPIQDLHGYDYPWPAGGGKNLFDIDDVKQYSNWSATIATSGNMPSSNSNKIYTIGKLQEGKTYTISFDFVSDSFPGFLYFGYYDENGVTTRLEYITTDHIAITSYTFVAIADAYYCLRMGQTITQPMFDTQISKIQTVQLEINSSATSWVPYSNICPISGHDSAQLFRTGKNLLDTRQESIPQYADGPGVYANVTYTPNNDGSITINGTSTGASVLFFDPVTLNPLTSYPFPTWKYTNNHYTFSVTDEWVLVTGDAYIQATVKKIKDDSIVSRQRLTASVLTRSFTVREDEYIADAFVRLSSGASAQNVNIKIQLELGSTATDYEPYVSEPTPVTVQFGQTVYKGKLYSEQRKVLITNVQKTFDGSSDESWRFNDTGSDKNRAYIKIEDSKASSDIQSNYLKNYSAHTAYPPIYNGWVNSSSQLLVGVPTSITSLTDWTAFLALNPLDVLYELAEPFFIDLTQVQTADIEATPVASFETTLARPLETSEHYFSCSQAEGTPTPDSPIPITGVSEITAYRMGKNLCPIFTGASGNGLTTTVNPDGTIHVTGTATGSGGFITSSNVLGCAIPSGQQITISISNTIPGRLRQFLAGVGRDSSSDINAGERSTTFSRDFGIASIRLYLFTTAGQSYDFSFKLQIELGSTATPYEPYNGESITVSLGGTYYCGKLVQSEDGSRKLVLTHGLISKAIADMNNSDTYPGWRNSGIKDMVGSGIDGSETGILNIGTNYSFNTKGTNDIVYLPRGSYNNLTQPQWIENYPDLVVQILVPLAEPIEISLPDGDPLTTIVGENNVYCNTGDTALTYYFNMVADPIRIPALVGTNNVYSDAGDVEVEYYTTLEGGND